MSHKYKILLFFFYSSPIFAGPGLTFIENKGQWRAPYDFAARANGAFFGVRAGEFTYTLLDTRQLERHHLELSRSEVSKESNLINGYRLKSSFLNYNVNTIPTPFGKHSEYYNYFVGASSQWHSKVNGFDGVVYKDFYCGVDLIVYSEGGNVKYDFSIEPGTDPSAIQWKYDGAESLTTEGGNLSVKTPLADIIEQKPIAYQWIGDEKKYVSASYKVEDRHIRFQLSDYDACYPLVIDPLLIFSTYSGSTADNWGSSATPGERGTLYSSGTANLYIGGSFPTTTGAFQTRYGGVFDVSILKYDSTGHRLLYATYLGGSNSETPHSMVMDKDQNLLVLGTTSSTNFPVSATAIQSRFAGGVPIDQFSAGKEIPIPYELGTDLFITKISKDGTTLLASTYLGGTNNDGINPNSSSLVKNYGDQMRGDIIGDTQGNIFISTVSSSPDFPVSNSFNTTYKGGETDGLIIKLNSDLSQLVWGAFMGGNNNDASHTIKIDNKGNLFVGGGTVSTDFPTTSGSYQPTQAGDADGWIAKIKSDGSAIMKSTFTGTSDFNQVYFLDLDKNQNVFVYGQTVGAFPVTQGAYSNPNSGQFLQKFDSTLSTLSFSTVFGSGIGIPNISPTAFLVNDCNNIYLSGWGGIINSTLGYWNSSTRNMPITSEALQKTTSGSDFYFMVLSQDGKQLLYSTYLGGPDSRTHVDGGTSRFDKSGVVYHVVCSGCQYTNSLGRSSSDFPTTSNAWSRFNRSLNCNNAAFKFDLSSLRATIQTNNISLNKPGGSQFCLNDKVVFQNLSIGGQTFIWNLGNNNTITKTDTMRIIQKYDKPGNYDVKLKIIDNGTCAGKDSTTVRIVVNSPLGTAEKSKSICLGTEVTLLASGGQTYTWTTADNSYSSALPNPTVSPKQTTTYYVSIADANGCTVKDTVKLTVIQAIDLKFKADVLYGCDGRPALKVENLTNTSEDVFFDFGDGSTSDQQQATHNYATDGTYTVTLKGKKEFCVFESQPLQLPIYYRFIPNVFTPDGTPGLNDTFMLQYGNAKPIAGATLGVKVSLTVVDRWGKLVYENKDYKNDWAAHNVNAGVYFFEATIQGETSCKGWVEVIK